MLDERNAAILRTLIYPIQFDSDPEKGIDRALEVTVFADHLQLDVRQVIAAIDAGIASGASLSELIPQRHSEDVIRGYLIAVRTRLEAGHGN
jgi:hypothetical protein